MPQRFGDLSPQLKARLAGVFQLLEAFTATFGQVIVLGKLIVTGDASATSANILGHQHLLWLGFASSLVGVIFHIAWALLLYQLLKPVHRTLSLFAAFIILVGCAVQAVTTLLYITPLIILQAAGSLSAFTPEQLHAISFLFIELNSQAFDLYLVFFGLWCILTGYLIFRSTFFLEFSERCWQSVVSAGRSTCSLRSPAICSQSSPSLPRSHWNCGAF